MQRNASTFGDYITAEENAQELAFARAAGDVPMTHGSQESHEGCEEEASSRDRLPQESQKPRDEAGLSADGTHVTGASAASSSGLPLTLTDALVENDEHGMEIMEGEASATARTAEGQAELSNNQSHGSKQTDLKHWLI